MSSSGGGFLSGLEIEDEEEEQQLLGAGNSDTNRRLGGLRGSIRISPTAEGKKQRRKLPIPKLPKELPRSLRLDSRIVQNSGDKRALALLFLFLILTIAIQWIHHHPLKIVIDDLDGTSFDGVEDFPEVMEDTLSM